MNNQLSKIKSGDSILRIVKSYQTLIGDVILEAVETREDSVF